MKSVSAVGLLACLTLAGLSACSSAGSSAAPVSVAEAATVSVLYEVDGSASAADITLETGSGTSQQSVKVPLTSKSSGKKGLTFNMERGAFVYISAQNTGQMRPGASINSPDFYGRVTCRITVDGKVISENSTTSKYGIASCKGTAR